MCPDNYATSTLDHFTNPGTCYSQFTVVFVPDPSMQISVPSPPSMVSLPAPATIQSLPPLPLIMSSAELPRIRSFPEVPLIVPEPLMMLDRKIDEHAAGLRSLAVGIREKASMFGLLTDIPEANALPRLMEIKMTNPARKKLYKRFGLNNISFSLRGLNQRSFYR